MKATKQFMINYWEKQLAIRIYQGASQWKITLAKRQIEQLKKLP